MILRSIVAGALALGLTASLALAQTSTGSGPLTVAKGGTGATTASAARTNLGVAIGSAVEAWDADLDCLAANSSNGLYARTGAGTCAVRTITAPAAGITVTNGNGVSGNPTLALADDLAALEGMACNGLATRVTISTWACRAIVAPAAGMTISASDGQAGNPTIVLANDLAALEALSGTGIARRTGTDAWSVGTTVSVAEGGTGQTTAAAARAAGLNIDQMTPRGDAAYTILATDRVVATNATFTASRIWTLPAANSVNAGQSILIADFAGGVSGVNTLVITRAGSDTINGGTTATISNANGAYYLVSDGSSKWTAQSMGAASGGGVTSVTCGTGLTGGTITTSGTCALALNSATLAGSPSNPTGTSSASQVMMGLGVTTCRLAPVYSTRMKVTISGTVLHAGVASVFYTGRYGSGAGPANGAAATGTTFTGSTNNYIAINGAAAGFSLSNIITGLTPATTYWFDVSLGSNNTGSNASMINVTCTAMEF